MERSFFDKAVFHSRRERLAEKLGDRGVMVLFAAPTAIRNNDVEHPYRQDSDFYFLTGFDEADSAMVLSVQDGRSYLTLFVPPKDPERETWDGLRAGVEGAVSMYGADAAYPIGELSEKLIGLLDQKETVHLALGRNKARDAQFFEVLSRLRSRNKLGAVAPDHLVDIRSTVHEMRLFKDDYEITLMHKAAAASVEAHRLLMKTCRPGLFEFELEAELLLEFKKHGAERPAYESIVGSGPNATILHHRRNNRRLEDGELLLVDAGAEIGYYAADITRTVPVNGRFTPAQRRVYDVVLEAQKAAIKAAVAGATIDSVHQEAVRILTRAMIDFGWIEGPLESAIEKKTYRKYYMHGTSHWLGMDVHDVGTYTHYQSALGASVQRRLEPGMVLTVEPGLYVAMGDESVAAEYRGIGIRIEDDVLVTADGNEVLTAALAKEPDEIEVLMATRAGA